VVGRCITLVRNLALLALLVSLATSMTVADEGHEHELTEQEVGTVHFPVSCSPEVQKHFERAVALLHSFAFDTAQQAFRDVAAGDSHCAMAHWGIAMTDWRWSAPDAARRKQAWNELQTARSLHAKTARERDYIRALAALYRHPEEERKTRLRDYSRAMGKLHAKYPEDHEAAAFYAWSLIESEPAEDPNFSQRRQAAAVLEPLFAIEPNHPGITHYLIHAYDKPGMAELGLPAARRYAKVAPAAPHALHMPSHIFARLGLWQEDIASNLASIAASRNATAMRMGDQGHQYHAMEFLVYAYLQCGREAEAERVIGELKDLPEMKDMYSVGYDPRLSAEVEFPATYVLELHDWKAAASIPAVAGAELGDESSTYLVRALGSAHLENVPAARENIAHLEKIRLELLAQKKGTADEVGKERDMASAWADHAEGKNEEALGLLRDIAAKDDGMFSAQGELPGHELMADFLMEMNQPQRALSEYEAELKLSPNRFDSLYGAARAAEAAGENERAQGYYVQLVKSCEGGSSDRPELLHAKQVVAGIGAH
jgi:hypothetical protein